MVRCRAVMFSDVARHPVHSLSPRDYIFESGDMVQLRATEEARIVVGQEGNHLRLAEVEYVPGSATAFACRLAASASIFEVMRPKRGPRAHG